MTSYSITGTKALRKAILNGGQMAVVKQIVKTNIIEMSRATQQNMKAAYVHVDPRTGHNYSTGTTMRSAKPVIDGSGLTGRVAPETDYFPYLEFGTRYMQAEPTLKPAFEQQAPKFKDDLQRLVK